MSDSEPAKRPSGHAEAFTRGTAIGVDVAAIERELCALWRKASERDASVTRACLWNLVVTTDDEAHELVTKELVNAVVPVVPARVIVLERGRPGGPEIEAWVSANCQIAPGGGKLVCSEEVTLAANGPGVDHLPSLVRALTVPDVPSAVVALGVPWPLGDGITRLLPGVGRLVVDTGTLGAGGELAALTRLATTLTVADLGWIRLSRFRWALASLFDPPIGGDVARRASGVRLRVSAIGVAPAMLVLGWLSARLGWTGAARSGESTWRARGAAGPVELAIAVEDIDAGRDGIYAIELSGAGGATFSVEDSGLEHLELRGTGLPTRTVAAPVRSDVELLVAALGGRGHDPQLNDALASAAALAGA